MAFTTPKLGLKVWNLLSDLYDHSQLADNWAKVDYHDHSPGRGVQIPTEGLADGAVTSPKLATALDPSGAYTTWKTLRVGTATIGASIAANTYVLSEQAPTATLATAGVLGTWYFDPAEQIVSGRSTKLRLKTSLISQQSTAPGVNFTLSLRPVTAVSGGTLTVGAAVAGSTVTYTTPATNSLNNAVTAEFDPPAAGYYLLAVANSGSTAASSSSILRAHLQVHHV